MNDPAIASFRPTPDVSARINDRFLEIMSSGQPDKRNLIAQALRSGAFLQNFDHLMRSYGFDPLNLADVVAAYYIVAWEVVQDKVPSRAEIAGTRGQIVAGLSRKRELSMLSNARKQDSAETLKMLSAMALTSYEDFKRRGDRDGLARFQAIIRGSLKQQGVDLAELAITDHGFVTR